MALKVNNNKWIAILFLVIAMALIKNPFTKFPFTFIFIILFVLVTIFFQDGNLKDLNFKKVELREFKIIILAYVILELLMDFVIQPAVSFVCNEPADYSSFKIIEGNNALYFKWLFNMWVSAAIGEELLFRGYVFSQLKRIIGNKKIVIIIISAILFSVPHLYQGLSGLVMTFLFGIFFAMLYNKYQNIWINIIVHGLIDTLFLTLSYLGYTNFYNLLNI